MTTEQPVLGDWELFLLRPRLREPSFLAACASRRQLAVSPAPARSPRTREHMRARSEQRSDDEYIYQMMGSTSLQEKISPKLPHASQPRGCRLAQGCLPASSCWVGLATWEWTRPRGPVR